MRILIAGDSWGYCWIPDGNGGGHHPGIEKILTDRGHTVVNLATPGFSNIQAVETLEKYSESADLCIFIQTEPIREWWIDTKVDRANVSRPVLDAEHVFSLALAHRGLVSAMNTHLKNIVYARLKTWMEQQNTRVLLVGGCSKITAEVVPSPLIVAVPSWCELLFENPTFKDHLFQDTGQWLSYEYADLVHSSRDVDLMVDWFQVTRDVLDKTAFRLSNEEYFKPDPWHPNFKGHEKLVDFLEKNFFSGIGS